SGLGVFSAGIQLAATVGVAEINQQAQTVPDQKSDPGGFLQVDHQIQATENAEHRQYRAARNLERPRQIRPLAPQDQNPGADHGECAQGADVGEFGQIAQRNQAADQRHDN